MSNKKIYIKSKGVILEILQREFPKPIDIDIFHIEDKNSERILKNYDDVMRSWNIGYDFDNNPIQEELYIYRETLRSLVEDKLIVHDTEDCEHRRRYNRCRLSPHGRIESLKAEENLLMLEPNFYGIGIRLRVLLRKVKTFVGKSSK